MRDPFCALQSSKKNISLLTVHVCTPDSRVRPSLLGHEWNHPQLLTSERRRSTLQNHRGENIPGHLPLHRGPLPDDSAQESFLHGHRRGCPQGQDEPIAWSTLPVSQRCGTERKKGQGQVGPLTLLFCCLCKKKFRLLWKLVDTITMDTFFYF